MGEYAVAKTSVWWDIENCCVPRRCDPQLIVQNVSSALATAGYRGPISVSAYGDTHQIAHNVQHALSSTGVSLNHVPAGIKDASDKKILVDMLFWAIDNPPPANYLLISGDRDFSNAIHKLKMRRYNILLAQPPNVSQTLTAAAKSVWLWKSLVTGEPPLAQSPYISSTSSGNKVDLDKSKNIVSSSSDVSQDTYPEVLNILCDPQSDANGNADKKYEVKKPQEMQTDNVSKQSRRKQKKRSNTGGSGFTKQTVFKKSKGGSRKRLICFRCGHGHCAAECTFSGDCNCCGKPGHKDLLCRANPDRIFRWIPAQAHNLATSLPGPENVTSSSQLQPTCSPPLGCSQQVTPGVSSPSPAPPVAPALPQTGDRPSSAPAHSGVYAMPTAVEVGRDNVPQPTTSVPRPPMGVPAYRLGQGQGMICFKCGVVGHCAAECSYIGSCHHCGQLGHMESVCKDNPDSIIKWEQVHAYASATSLQGSVLMKVPASQLHQTWAPSSWSFLQATPTVPTPSPTPAAPALPHTDVAASSTPAQSGDYAMPTAMSLGKQDVVPRPTSSVLCPPMSVLAYRPVLGQYHQVPQPTTSAPRPPMGVPAYRPGQGQGMICFKCGVVGHCAAECSYIGSCHHCGQLGHMESVCKDNPDSIIKWEQVHAYASATSLQGSVHMNVPASQLHQSWAPSSGCFLQATPTVPTPSPTPAAPALPHTGVAASSTPAQSGDCAMPTAMSLGKQDVVPRPTSSVLCPPMSVLAYRPVLGQYHQVSTSQLLPAGTQPPYAGVAASSTPAQSGVCATPTDVQLGKPDVVPQLTSSAPRPPTAVLAYRPVLGQYHQVGTSQLLPALTKPPGYFWQAAPVVPAPHVTPMPPQPGIAASPRPAHHGVYPMPFPFGRPWW